MMAGETVLQSLCRCMSLSFGFLVSGTLGGASTKVGIKGITVEIGNPQLLQTQFVQWTTSGIMSALKHFRMVTMVSVTHRNSFACCFQNLIHLRLDLGGSIRQRGDRSHNLRACVLDTVSYTHLTLPTIYSV